HLLNGFGERSPDQSLRAFLAYLRLVELSGIDPDPGEDGATEMDPDAVSLMTIHQAKGLEFDAVFLPSVVEGRLPQPARGDRYSLPISLLEPTVRGREDHVAEERRLFYVALTRARTHLYVTWAERYEGERTWR